ncbi:MAG TPA: small ribosomal subunit Rsm22 family protein [Polyangiaceae bacterium]|jgi:SAM-dependent methyltransferase
MPRSSLLRPLEEDWRDTLDAIARARGWPASTDVARLAAQVEALSHAYNDPSRASAAIRDAGAARLGFSFARDVPKGAAAVRELVATGALQVGAGLRILDVGAGLGATTWGVVRALEAAGGSGIVEATWLDSDARALEVASAIARAREGTGAIRLRVTTMHRPATGAFDALPRFDLVLVGQVLSELDVGAADDARVARHAELLATWLDRRVEPHGSLVVVEPALRDRSRHLHRVRDALVASGATVFAPCLHAAPCPVLARETDWCHEDLDVDLPAWLVPVARAAGLRREGLTFSYLVLRKDGVTLASSVAVPASATRLRVVSGAIATKGKLESFLCGELDRDGARVVARARTMRLDRDRSPKSAAWDALARGDVLVIDPAPDLDRPRIGSSSTVARLEPGEMGRAPVSSSGDSKSR